MEKNKSLANFRGIVNGTSSDISVSVLNSEMLGLRTINMAHEETKVRGQDLEKQGKGDSDKNHKTQAGPGIFVSTN